MNRSNPANIIRKMNARSHLLFIHIQNPPEAAGPLKRCRFWKASLLLMCCSEIWIVLEREWIGAKCIRSDMLNQPWIESVWCVCIWVNWYRCWLEPLGPVAWITDIQTSMKRRLQAAIWCFRACCPWEGHSCFLRKCHFRFQQIGCETCKVLWYTFCGTHCLIGVISLQRCNDVAQYSVISPKKEPQALGRNYSNAFYSFIIKANARNK